MRRTASYLARLGIALGLCSGPQCKPAFARSLAHVSFFVSYVVYPFLCPLFDVSYRVSLRDRVALSPRRFGFALHYVSVILRRCNTESTSSRICVFSYPSRPKSASYIVCVAVFPNRTVSASYRVRVVAFGFVPSASHFLRMLLTLCHTEPKLFCTMSACNMYARSVSALHCVSLAS